MALVGASGKVTRYLILELRDGLPGGSLLSMGRLRRAQSTNQAFSLIELMVVLVIISVLAIGAAGLGGAILGYAKVRSASETMLWEVRKIQAFTRTAGVIVRRQGIYLLQPQGNEMRWGYFVFGAYTGADTGAGSAVGLPLPAAGTQLAALDATVIPYVKFLPLGVNLVNPTTGAAMTSSPIFAFGSGGISFPGGAREIGITDPAVGMFRLIQRGPDRHGFLALTGLQNAP